jgi:hypothetical protein
MPKPKSKKQARLFGAVAGGRARKAKGMSSTQARDSLGGVKVKRLPLRKRKK